MKKAILILQSLFLGLIISTSFAGEVTVFGPKKYLRTTGSPNEYSDSLIAKYEDPWNGRLCIKNGEEDGTCRITSARIFVNDVEIFSPDDFKNHTYLMEAPLSLSRENTIEIILMSKPGSYLTIEVMQDVSPPTVEIEAVPNSIYLGESAELFWNAANTDYCLIRPQIGGVGPSGSAIVSPFESTIYQAIAIGAAGYAVGSAAVEVYVNNDLEPIWIDTTHTEVDSQSLELTGNIQVRIKNNGILPI